MSLAKFSVRQAVLVNLLFIVFIIAGVVVYQLLPVDVYPDISLDEAWIRTDYPGASPEDVEHHVTRKIEEELEDIQGVSRVASYSVANVSSIFVKFDESLDPIDYEASFQEVRNRLDRVSDLPGDAEEPILTRLTLSEVWPIVQVVIADDGEAGERVVREVARDLKDALRDIEGVAKIKEMGLREREVHILVDKLALERYRLSLTEVAGILSRSNINIPGGNVQTEREEFTLRAVGDAETLQQLEAIPIKMSPHGDHVYLHDVARLEENFERRTMISRYMGKKCAFLYIAKTHQADSISVRDRVNEVISRYGQVTAPPGVTIDLFADATQMIKNRLDVLKRNLGVGILLVFVILWMFIGARNSVLAIVGIPFAFLCAFIFMYFIDVSINAVSVFALVLISGMIVDDAIVVLENIYRHLQEGKGIRDAIIDGTEQVMWPVVSSALTTIAAFLPLLIMTGVIGRFFSIIPKTVTVALLASLFECLVILPSHFLHWGPRSHSRQTTTPRFGRLRERLSVFYRKILEQTLAHRYACLAAVVMMGFCAYQAQRTLTVELFPSDFPTLVATFNVEPGASLEKTDKVCLDLLPVLDEFVAAGYVKTHSTSVGLQVNEDNQMRRRPNIAQIWVELMQTQSLRGYDPEEVMDDIRNRLIAYVDNHPEQQVENLRVWPIRDGPPTGKPVSLRIEHPDYRVARSISNNVQEMLRSMDGVFDVGDNLDAGQRELQMQIKKQAASEFGLTFQDIFTTLSGANEGLIVGTFKDRIYDEDLDIRLKYQQDFRSSEEHLLDVDIKSPVSGSLIKLRQVANLTYDQGYANHYRYDGRRAILVTADVDEKAIDVERVNHQIQRKFLPLAEQDDQLHIVAEGQFEETHESFKSLRYAGIIAICVMYLILAAQFKSYSQPAIVLSSLAFGTIGMVFGLVLNQYAFSVVTGIALVGMFGIMINDAIVLVSFINEERERTVSVIDALIRASLVRARPILLTTATTVFGLLPMALGVGGYNKIWSPFATCICWGLTSATLLILLLLPAFYLIVEDAESLLGRLVGKADGYAQARELDPV